MIESTTFTTPHKGRGAQFNTPNSFDSSQYGVFLPEGIDDWSVISLKSQYLEENSKTVVNRIKSPDIPLSFSLNPYQGCEHGCIYCYARYSHEYWGYSAGLDFEQKILYKRRAPELLRELFSRKSWLPAPISLSGNTDCYQPIERKLEITRKLLEVCLDYRNPVGIITKNSLILRDLDLLQELAKKNLVSVYTSLTSMDEDLRRKMEPRTTTYKERLRVIEKLSKAGIFCGVMNAPIIPAINDSHMFEVLRQASYAGAKSAGYTLVRLNGALGSLFADWLNIHFPERAPKVLNLISSCHDGKLNDSRFSSRMKGEGNVAEMIEQQFKLYCNQFNLNKEKFNYSLDHFVRLKPGQLRLF